MQILQLVSIKFYLPEILCIHLMCHFDTNRCWVANLLIFWPMILKNLLEASFHNEVQFNSIYFEFHYIQCTTTTT